MNIYELKKLNTKNGGHFFNPGSMALWGQTMKSFYVTTEKGIVTLQEKDSTREYQFDAKTGRQIHN